MISRPKMLKYDDDDDDDGDDGDDDEDNDDDDENDDDQHHNLCRHHYSAHKIFLGDIYFQWMYPIGGRWFNYSRLSICPYTVIYISYLDCVILI